MTITIRSSTLGALADPALRKELAPGHGHAVELTDLGVVVARREDIYDLADQLAEEELLEEMSSYGKRTTGVDNTVWISPRGDTCHGPCLKVAIDTRTQSAPAAKPPQSQLTTEVSSLAMALPRCSNKSDNSLTPIATC
jgi:hypothetical protein